MNGDSGAAAPSLAGMAGTRRAFHTTTTRAAGVLDVLAAGPITDRNGLAMGTLLDALDALGVPEHHKGGGAPSRRNRRSVLAGLVARLEAHGFVATERGAGGRRTFSIALGPVVPTDHVPTPRTPADVDPVEAEEAAADVDPVEAEEAAAELHGARERHPAALGRLFPVEPADDVDAFPDAEAEAAALGGRPGRLAARIERQVPELVNRAVHEAIDARLRDGIALVAELLGYVPASLLALAREERDTAITERDTVAERVTALNEELRRERNEAHAARTEANRLLARTVKVNASTVSVHALPESLRAVATDAVNAGWSIHSTNGGHYAFRHLHARRPVFAAATPSDWRTPRNLKRDLDAALRGD